MISPGKAFFHKRLADSLRRFVFPVGAVFLYALVLLFVGCSQKERAGKASIQRPEGLKKTASARDSSYIKEYSGRLKALLSPVGYSYDPGGKPDPFQPFIRGNVAPAARRRVMPSREAEQEKRVCESPLECMDVGQLTLVAVIEKKGGERIAMAQDAAGIGYFLKKGTKVGFHEGEVVAVLPDRVIIHEKGEDLVGRPIVKERFLALHPEEE